MKRLGGLLILLLVSSSVAAQTVGDGLNVSVALGASVSAASGGKVGNAVTPFADVLADFPVIVKDKEDQRFRVQLEGLFAGQPGQSINLSDLTTFNTVTFNGGFHFVLGKTSTARSTVSVSGGVSARLSSEAKEETPAHMEACIGMWQKDHTASFNFCPVGFSSEVGDAATVGRADGRVTIKNALRLQIAIIYPYANAPSNYWQSGTKHNVTAIVSISADMDHIFSQAKVDTVPAPRDLHGAISDLMGPPAPKGRWS